ncbi:MAG: recombinase family protein [Isosphaeraceae bacterium]
MSGFPRPCYPDISGNSCRQSSRGRHPPGGVEEGLDVQKEALDKAGVDRLFVDVASGAKATLPQLQLALSQLRNGDTLVVWRLNRLGRSLGHLIRTVEELGSRGIGFRSLDENIDTTTGTSKPLSHFFAALGQFDRNLIQERTAAGRAAARACGRTGGRKPKLDEEKQAQAVTLYNAQGLSVDDICATLQIAPRTLFRYLRQGNKRKAGRKPKTKTADGLSTHQGRKVGKNAPQTVDNPKHRPTIARAGPVPSKDPRPAERTAASSRRGLGGHDIAQRDSPHGGGKDAGELEGHPASPNLYLP